MEYYIAWKNEESLKIIIRKYLQDLYGKKY